MPAVIASAPGKIILFGEHAVVYSRPAIAIPVHQVRARAIVTPNITGKPGEVQISAPDIQLNAALDDLPHDHPLAVAIHGIAAELNIAHFPAFNLRVTSTIPIAAGLGSGAAVSVAVIRVLAAFLQQSLTDDQVSALAYAVEQHLHGTPSGIDNTVITYACPVYFQRDQPFEVLHASAPLTFVIGNTGIQSPTTLAVADVRAALAAQPERYETLFNRVGQVTRQARAALETGEVEQLGRLMTRNHALLQQIGVSCAELDHLVNSALENGAFGAKLSGGGRGGNMIALASTENAANIANALISAGAHSTIITNLQPQENDG